MPHYLRQTLEEEGTIIPARAAILAMVTLIVIWMSMVQMRLSSNQILVEVDITAHAQPVLKEIGVVIILFGVAINGYSAVLREKDSIKTTNSNDTETPVAKRSFVTGAILCIIAGVMSPMLQFAFIYGRKIVETAVSMNVNETMATNAIWIVALFGGFIVNICYCTWLLRKNQTWKLYKSSGTKWYHLYALIMGFLWVVTIATYGMAVTNMGKQLGPSVGWAIFMSVGIIMANILGLMTKEWKGVQKKTIYTMITGLLILVLGTCVVGWAQFISMDNM